MAVSFFITTSLFPFAFAQEISLSKDQSKEKIHVTADSLTSESNAKFAEFKGNVKVTQGDFVIISDSLKILYKESGGEKKAGTTESIEKIIATGNVKIESEETTAVSQQAEYDTNSMIMVLTGEDSSVFDKKNSVTGSKITFNRKDGIVKAEGDKNKRVSAVFFPDEKTTPGKEPEKKKTVYTAAVTQISSEKIKPEETKKIPEAPVKTPVAEKSLTIIDAPVKTPAPEKSLNIIKEEKKPVVQAKADIQEKAPPVSVVFVPPGSEKSRKADKVIQKASYGTLIKSIGIAIVENRTGNPSLNIQDDFNRHITGALNRSCPGITLFQADDENFPPVFIKPPVTASGGTDSFRMCETGRKLGLSAIMTSSVTEIKAGEEPRGILWYRDSHPFVSISVHFDVYDTETGAKLLDENIKYKRDSDELEIESLKAGKIEPLLLKDAFEKISKDAGRKICEIMKKQPWKGYVTSVSGEKISISSGNSKGITPGNTFEVYENRMLEGKDGRKFYIPGSKVGVIKITAVNEKDAEAILVAGDSVRAGYTIRAK